MLSSFSVLDRLLRGDSTHPKNLEAGSFPLPIGGLSLVLIVLGLAHGFCVAWFALFNHQDPQLQQVVATSVKVPALFLLTLAVTFPSLYVFNALVGSRLRLLPLLRLMVATIGVTLAVLASFGPIVAFFSVSTTSYPFMVLLNVLAFAVAGVLGLKFLHQTLRRLSVWEAPLSAIPVSDAGVGGKDEPLGALDPAPDASVLGPYVRPVFVCWSILFGLVGSQMGWVLRPFIGRPDVHFEWFRVREGSFFEAVGRCISALF